MTLKDVFNLKTLFLHRGEKDLRQYNFIGDQIILSVFAIFFCIIGLVGNGNIVRLLGFRIKRKPFAIYILNLAVADFGSLVFLLLSDIRFYPPFLDYDFGIPTIFDWLLLSLFASLYSSSQLLLTAISIDRWLYVLIPNLYRCCQSPVLSTTVCAFIWALSSTLIGAPLCLLSMDLLRSDYIILLLLGIIVTTLACLFLVIISTLTLFFQVCLKSPRCQCGNPLRVTLLILLSFLLFSVLIYAFFNIVPKMQLIYIFLCSSLKGSINPLIYFLAGRESGGKFQERMKVLLQRVFREERETPGWSYSHTPKQGCDTLFRTPSL